MGGITWEQGKQQHGSPDKSSEVTPQPNRDPYIVPKLKTLRSRLPRRRQEAAFAAFAFGPRGRGSSTQGFCSFKTCRLVRLRLLPFLAGVASLSTQRPRPAAALTTRLLPDTTHTEERTSRCEAIVLEAEQGCGETRTACPGRTRCRTSG